MGKRTVAIIGETGKFCPGLAKAAVQQDLRLLFISRQNPTLAQELKELSTAAEVEFLSCEKEGCWEADAIAFIRPDEIQPELLERIRKVATQKPVLVISSLEENEKSGEKFCFQELLPHSQVVELKLAEAEFGIFGRKAKVNETVRDFFEAAGYKENKELWK
ncbi:hypothetical protein [Salinimicrobium sp. HB62]|uniref:hypothetical protein n=1 Tax=Salinimicrobium sp. HB62 TaxID=3077781 RepID=UPI002D7860D0|nr:hypothetical protein [Salinimicrobium sp. HB62]